MNLQSLKKLLPKPEHLIYREVVRASISLTVIVFSWESFCLRLRCETVRTLRLKEVEPFGAILSCPSPQSQEAVSK